MNQEPLTLAAFRELHPWPDSLQGPARTAIEWLWSYDVDASADAVWSVFVDTRRLNRALGLSPWELSERDGLLHARGRLGGLAHEWVEWPWNWVSGIYMDYVRDYARGISRIQRTVYRVDPRERGSRIHIYLGWIPRSLVGRIALAVNKPLVRRGFERVIAGIDDHRDGPEPSVYRVGAPELSPYATSRLAAVREELNGRGIASEVVALVTGCVEELEDLDLHRLRPRELARRWGADNDELLRGCLHATRIGLLEMSWDVVCPHCRGVREQARHLGDIPAEGACAPCAIRFRTDAETAVEITFRVHPSIREVPDVHHCIAEAWSKPHIRLQHAVAPGQRLEVSSRLAPGRYRLRLLGRDGDAELEVEEGGPGEITWVAGSGAPDPGTCGVDPSITLVNCGDELERFVIEDLGWEGDPLRPSHVFSHQDFRDLFSEEYLAEDVRLSVGDQTLLFTDIVGSTEFYAARGDPEAFVEVRRHFDEVDEVVRAHRGAVVKTIGDAVMAAFSDPSLAVKAAGEIQRRFDGRREDTGIRLRASVNTGPCIAVNLNAGIDYFGSSVNLAAKLQTCAGAGQVALAGRVVRDPGVAALVDREGIALREVPFESAAAGGAVTVYRWNVGS